MNLISNMWEEICFHLSENIKPSFSEKDFESQVVRALEVLGWREFRNEIKRQPTIQLGREGTLRPDLIVFDQGKRALIVLEVKRPSENITKDDTIGQLRSYMRQMKSDFGFLVGSELRVYYDGSSNPQSDPLLLEKISFARNSTEGINFIKNFNKNSFLEKEYTRYLEMKIKKFSIKREINKLTKIILSEDTNQKIIGYLRTEFADYGDETFSEAIKKLSITITTDQPQDQQVQETTVRPPITTNLRQKAYRNYFQSLIDELREKYQFTNAKIGQPQSWYAFSSVVSNIYFGACFGRVGKARTELYIDVGDREKNKALFDWLYEQRDEIQSKVGQELEWERLDNKRASRIAAYRKGSIQSDEEELMEIKAWHIENLLQFKKVFTPLLNKGKAKHLT